MNETTSNDQRQEVAEFAAWCIGSANGDGDQRVDTEYERVLADQAAFAYWERIHGDFERQRAAGCQDILCGELPGDPFDDALA